MTTATTRRRPAEGGASTTSSGRPAEHDDRTPSVSPALLIELARIPSRAETASMLGSDDATEHLRAIEQTVTDVLTVLIGGAGHD